MEATSLSQIPTQELSEYVKITLSSSKQFADSTVLHWRAQHSRIATLKWLLSNSKTDTTFYTVAVFSQEGSLLFDGILSNLITKISDLKTSSSIDPRDTQGIEASARISSLTGSVTLHWRVIFTAEISPYLAPQTNDGRFDLATNEITCWKSS